MPPPVAACLVVGFIFWLLRRYSRTVGGMSWGLLIPLLWVGINASRPVGYWFATGTAAAAAGDALEGSPIDRNVYLVLIVAGLLVLSRRRIEWNSIFFQGRWLFALYAYLLASTIWSDFSFISFKRWIKDAGDIIMILIVLTEKNPVEALRGIFVRCAFMLIPLSVLFIKWYPAIGRYTHRWTYTQGFGGVTNNKNSLGLLALLCGLFLLWHIVDLGRIKDTYRRAGFFGAIRVFWPDLTVLGMCVWLLSIANSATALTCFILGVLIFFGIRLPIVRANFASLGWCFFGAAALMITFTVSPGFRGMVAGALGRDVTLTERTIIWANVVDFQTNVLLGNGFSSTWLMPQWAEFVDEYRLAHAHNGYLETYLHSGWVGVGLLTMVLVAAGRNATRHLRQGTVVGPLFLALLLSGLLYNYTEVSFHRSNALGFVLWFLALSGGLVAHARTPDHVVVSDIPLPANGMALESCQSSGGIGTR